MVCSLPYEASGLIRLGVAPSESKDRPGFATQAVQEEAISSYENGRGALGGWRVAGFLWTEQS